ncbi:hypothetical protein HDU67_000509 [Dinochytrium kinnereticum]|nr:hypothetical protein HDU67_000509 [Dinochytrium kinnereticum]
MSSPNTNIADEVMFPDDWHIAFNRVWVGICLAALLWCLAKGRLVPSSRRPAERVVLFGVRMSGSVINSAVVFRAYQMGLVAHSVFYVLEMVATSIVLLYPAMALHHIVALYIFLLFIMHPSNMSFVTIFPVFFHSLYWALGTDNITILALYNISLWIVGHIILFAALTRQAWDALVLKLALSTPKTSPQPPKPPQPLLPKFLNIPFEGILGISATSLFWVNYLTYCCAYQGSLCLGDFTNLTAKPPPPTTPLQRSKWMTAISHTLATSLTGLLISLLLVWVSASLWVASEGAELAVWLGQVDERDVMDVSVHGAVIPRTVGEIDYWAEDVRLFESWLAEGVNPVSEEAGRRSKERRGGPPKPLGAWDWKNARGLRMLKALTLPHHQQQTMVLSKDL